MTVYLYLIGTILVAMWANKLGRSIVWAVIGCIFLSPLVVAIYYLLVGSKTTQLTQINQPHNCIKMAEGVNGYLYLYEQKITIQKKTNTSTFLTQGLKGDKDIPIESITAIQYCKPTKLNGYIQFTIKGGLETKQGLLDAVKDENTIVFSKNQELGFLEIKKMIDERLYREVPLEAGRSSLDELEKLASLRDKRIITEEEFIAKKKQLLQI